MHRGRKTDYSKLPPILQRYDEDLRGLYSSTTREGHSYCLLMFHEHLETKAQSLERVTLNDIKSYINELTLRREKHEITQGTIKSVAKVIKYFAQWLVDQEMLDSSEFYKIERYVRKIPGGSIGNDDVEALSKEDEARAFRRLRDPLLAFLLWFGLNFGPRRIEYCNLLVSNIELAHMEGNEPAPRIKIDNSKGHVKKTRYYYLFPKQALESRKWLEYLKSLNLPHDHVFFNPKNPSEEPNIDRVSSWFVKMSKITGIHIPSHRLRYTYATRLWEGDVELYTISYLLGHSRVETTVRYLKISAKTFRKKFMGSAKHLF